MEWNLGKFVRAAFTVVEMMMAVAVIAVLTASIVPGLLRPRKRTRSIDVLSAFEGRTRRAQVGR
jgi:prepilin-type N-terminal cleavage/methylation domain-containing protein